MRVIRAATAGFCMGVGLALKKLERALAENTAGRRVRTLGPIIHNPQVLSHFAALGVERLDDPAQAGANDYALIRAHGVSLEVERALRRNCAQVEDATCPKVKKAQLAIAKATAAGSRLLLFGEAKHPEVIGLVSYARHGALVFESREELRQLDPTPGERWVLASQTTQDREIFDDIAASLAAKLPGLAILSTICDATRQRQAEALAIAARVDVMVVAGGRESGNTRRLAALARGSGIDAFHVESADELHEKDFRGKTIAGLTAGASTPGHIIDAVEKWLANISPD